MSPDNREQLARRRAASRRLPPLADGRRDPLDPPDRPGPSTFCLSRPGLAVEVQRRQVDGWAHRELRAVFANPAEMAA